MNTRNFINLIGHLGDHPKTTVLPSGTTVTEFSLATNDYYRDRDGNRQQRTDWHRVKAYGKAAEVLNQYLERGSHLSVVGTLRYRSWVDGQEQKRTASEIIIDSFSFIGAAKPGRYQAAGEDASLVAEPGSRLEAKTVSRRAMPTAAASLVTEETASTNPDADLPFWRELRLALRDVLPQSLQ